MKTASKLYGDGAPGMIYRTAPGTQPSLTIANFATPSCSNGVVTDIRDATVLAGTVVAVTNNARLRLMQDTTVGDIQLTATNAVLDLNGKTLTVKTALHGFTGSVTNYGAIVWARKGSLIVIR